LKYCVDTSALLDAWVRWYPPDAFPTFWERIDQTIEEDRLLSSEEVLHDLGRKEGDTLHAWAKQRKDIFLPLDDAVQKAHIQIMARFGQLVDGRTGKSFADPWVIATAVVNDCTVLTGEKPTGTVTRPKIPDVCKSLDIDCIGVMQFIRAEGWRF
jgi:hypothetical protein